MTITTNRLSIFVDGNNMFYAQQKNGWFFDPRRVLEYFAYENKKEWQEYLKFELSDGENNEK